MGSLFWLLANRTAETEFIFGLFHLLLAGLTLVVLLYHFRTNREDPAEVRDWLQPLGFLLLVLYFAILTLYFGAAFFFRRELGGANVERLSYGLMTCGVLIVVAAYVRARREAGTHLGRWILGGCAVVAVTVLIDILRSPHPVTFDKMPYFVANVLVLLAIGLATRVLLQDEGGGRLATLIALAAVGLFLILHSVSLLLSRPAGIFLWNAEQHVLSVSLFAFAWAVGEHSRNLLDRTFVRLNLTFIILASLIMLITASMEKYQYLHLAEERSMNLAEFLRGHIVYYRERGENLEEIFQQGEVLKRVVVEFGTLPELREVSVYLDGRRETFRYTPDWEISEEIVTLTGPDSPEADERLSNGFQMIRLPLASGTTSSDRIEFWGTMDYINEHIGKYIIWIYMLFTIMVGLVSGIVGIIVNDADRELRRQYAELQETHQQLAQAGKLASIGQLAGGMAHEINTPITSILSLASHLAEEKSTATLAPRHRESLRLIAQQAERVARIVGNLLKFSRQANLNLVPVDVAESLDTAITLVQYRLRDSAIHLQQKIAADLPFILGDADRLTEVFVNLLNNAIDAMPTGSTLVVSAFPNPAPDGGVRVEVTDTGCGITPEQLPRIFDPFFTTKEFGRGTGLGLSISHGIVKDHGGQIRAESRAGAGTTLIVILPRGGA